MEKQNKLNVQLNAEQEKRFYAELHESITDNKDIEICKREFLRQQQEQDKERMRSIENLVRQNTKIETIKLLF